MRYRRPGDYFTIDGEGKKKKLKSYFIDEKIPQEERTDSF
ncbi:MAG: tRNA lysidine(34) synthetase TilS [Coprococcus comes]